MPRKKKDLTLKVNHTPAEKIQLKKNDIGTSVTNPHETLFRRLQKKNRFVSGASLGNKVADIFASVTGSTPNRVFNEEELPTQGPTRMQQMEEVVASNKQPNNEPKNNNMLLYIAGAAVLYLIIKK